MSTNFNNFLNRRKKMKAEVKTITINGTEYVEKDAVQTQPAEKLDGMDYVIVRSYDAGCFAGYLKEKKEREVTLKKARRLWYWDGAASLSQLAMEGVSKPGNCKFPCEVDNIIINNVCEVINATEKAKKSIAGVTIWKK
jgi:hypothetical protein